MFVDNDHLKLVEMLSVQTKTHFLKSFWIVGQTSLDISILGLYYVNKGF